MNVRNDFDLLDQSRSRKKLIIKIAVTLLEVIAVVLLAYFITHHGMNIYTVSGQEMNPILKNGDRILVNKMSYRIHSVKRNDVVVIEQDGAGHTYYSADRVIGLPGETVQIKDGQVYIDGEKLDEKYDFPKMENGGLALQKITLKEDEYFVLCDNRNSGEDSRNAGFGNVSRDKIVGKAWFRMNTMEFVGMLQATEWEESEGSPKPTEK